MLEIGILELLDGSDLNRMGLWSSSFTSKAIRNVYLSI